MRLPALLIALGLTLLGASTYANTLEPDPRTLPPLKFACAVLEIDCTGIEPAHIAYAPLLEYGLYGIYYLGDNVIYVDADAPASVVVHEMTHYLLYQVGIIDGCISEEAARRVHHQWEGTPYNDEWRVQYSCPL